MGGAYIAYFVMYATLKIAHMARAAMWCAARSVLTLLGWRDILPFILFQHSCCSTLTPNGNLSVPFSGYQADEKASTPVIPSVARDPLLTVQNRRSGLLAALGMTGGPCNARNERPPFFISLLLMIPGAAPA